MWPSFHYLSHAMKKIIYIFLLLLSALAVSAQRASCDCAKTFPICQDSACYDIGSIANKNGHRIQICGIRDEWAINGDEDSAAVAPAWSRDLHSFFIIHDCQTGDSLFAQLPELEESWSRVIIGRDEILVEPVAFFSYSDLGAEDPPITICQTRISLKGDKVTVSTPMPKFVMPHFSQSVTDSATAFYNGLETVLKASKNDHAVWPDYNQYPDELLLVAALLDLGRAREMSRHLRKYFELDGHLSESYDAGWLDYLLDNQVKK